MEKIIRLINILDDQTIDKLVYLDRLVKLYSKFLETWKAAEVTSNGTNVRVKFFTKSKHGFESFTEREFPMVDIDKRIAAYKRKIKLEFGKRHENTRFIREKEVRKWKNYIKDATI